MDATASILHPAGGSISDMYWSTTTFHVTPSPELNEALRAWATHIGSHHPKIREVRCYRRNGGTGIIWQEGFENFHDYQQVIDEEDHTCEQAMCAVFEHMVPGTRLSQIWSDVL